MGGRLCKCGGFWLPLSPRKWNSASLMDLMPGLVQRVMHGNCMFGHRGFLGSVLFYASKANCIRV